MCWRLDLTVAHNPHWPLLPPEPTKPPLPPHPLHYTSSNETQQTPPTWSTALSGHQPRLPLTYSHSHSHPFFRFPLPPTKFHAKFQRSFTLSLSLSLSPFINSTQIHSHSEFHFTVISNPPHTNTLSLSLPWRSSFYALFLSLLLQVLARSRRPSLPLSSLSVSSSQIDECACITEFPDSQLGFSMALLGVFHTHHFQICKFHFFLIFFIFFCISVF